MLSCLSVFTATLAGVGITWEPALCASRRVFLLTDKGKPAEGQHSCLSALGLWCEVTSCLPLSLPRPPPNVDCIPKMINPNTSSVTHFSRVRCHSKSDAYKHLPGCGRQRKGQEGDTVDTEAQGRVAVDCPAAFQYAGWGCGGEEP